MSFSSKRLLFNSVKQQSKTLCILLTLGKKDDTIKHICFSLALRLSGKVITVNCFVEGICLNFFQNLQNLK